MKVIVFLFVMVITLACCKQKERLMTLESGHITQQPVNVVVKEEVVDTLVITTAPADVRQEEVTLTQGNEMMRYCVIVGSFIQEQNAVRLRNKLMNMGFLGSSIMQNKQGMFRVSVLCNDHLGIARAKLADIRNLYPQFSDAWLLQSKN